MKHAKDEMVIFRPIPDDKILNFSKFKAFADDKIWLNRIMKFVFDRVKYCGRGRKCWLPVFSPLHTMFLTLSQTSPGF